MTGAKTLSTICYTSGEFQEYIMPGEWSNNLHRELNSAFREGREIDLTARTEDQREIPATLLIDLLNERRRREIRSGGRLAIKGATVSGSFDLSHREFDCSLSFSKCHFINPVVLSGASLIALQIHDDSQAPSVYARYLRLSGGASFARLYAQSVDLAGAHLGGTLDLSNSNLTGRGNVALDTRGIRVSGDFRADHLVVTGNTLLEGARIDGLLSLRYASFTRNDDSSESEIVKIKGCSIGGALSAHGLKVRGGCLNLADTRVATTLRLSAATLSHSDPSACAMILDRCKVGGSIFCSDGLFVCGSIRAEGVEIGGTLYLNNSNIENRAARGDALNLDRCLIRGKIDAKKAVKAFTATGRITLNDGSVGGSVDFSGAILSNHLGDALRANRAHIGADLILSKGFKAEGTVKLMRTSIGCNLRLDDGTFVAAHCCDALTAEGIRVIGVITTERICCRGTLSFRNATIEGTLRIDAANIKSITEDAAAVTLLAAHINTLRFEGIPLGGRVDFTGATLQLLLDDPSDSFGKGEVFVLDGLTYRGIHVNHVERRHRLSWLENGTKVIRSSRSPKYIRPSSGYVPQPWQQLSSAYRRIGLNRDARIFLLKMHRYRNRILRWRSVMGFAKLWNYIQDAAIGYGYVPVRIFLWIGVLLIGSTTFFSLHRPNCSDAGDGQCQRHGVMFNILSSLLDSAALLIPAVGDKTSLQWRLTSTPSVVIAFLLSTFGWLLGVAAIAGINRVVRD